MLTIALGSLGWWHFSDRFAFAAASGLGAVACYLWSVGLLWDMLAKVQARTGASDEPQQRGAARTFATIRCVAATTRRLPLAERAFETNPHPVPPSPFRWVTLGVWSSYPIVRLSSLLGLVDPWREEAVFTALDVVAKVMFTVFCEQFAASVWDARALEARRLAEEKHTAINQFMRFVFHEVRARAARRARRSRKQSARAVRKQSGARR